jgi:hemoglobin
MHILKFATNITLSIARLRSFKKRSLTKNLVYQFFFNSRLISNRLTSIIIITINNTEQNNSKYARSEMKNIPTLYEWVGGMQTFETLFKVFYDKVLKDDLLREVFKNMSADHIKHVAHFVAEVFGGDKLYTTEDGGSHAKMIGHRIGKMLTDEKRQRWVQLLIKTADEVGLKSDPEFRSSFVGYLEWGSRIAVINSQLASNPMPHEELMPKWGWGETGGPYIPDNN